MESNKQLIKRRKRSLLKWLRCDSNLMLQHAHAKCILTDAEYQRLRPMTNPDAVHQEILDLVYFKGEDTCAKFLVMLKDEEIQETFPELAKWLSSLPEDGHHTEIMYHGTSREAAESIQREGFRQSRECYPLGKGVYLTRDLRKAWCYPIHFHVSHRVVIKVKVNVGRVIEIRYSNHPMHKTWHDHGYDTAWVTPNCGHPMSPSGMEEHCVWDPKRITFMDITYQKAGQ